MGDHRRSIFDVVEDQKRDCYIAELEAELAEMTLRNDVATDNIGVFRADYDESETP